MDDEEEETSNRTRPSAVCCEHLGSEKNRNNCDKPAQRKAFSCKNEISRLAKNVFTALFSKREDYSAENHLYHPGDPSSPHLLQHHLRDRPVTLLKQLHTHLVIL